MTQTGRAGAGGRGRGSQHNAQMSRKRETARARGHATAAGARRRHTRTPRNGPGHQPWQSGSRTQPALPSAGTRPRTTTRRERWRHARRRPPTSPPPSAYIRQGDIFAVHDHHIRRREGLGFQHVGESTDLCAGERQSSSRTPEAVLTPAPARRPTRPKHTLLVFRIVRALVRCGEGGGGRGHTLAACIKTRSAGHSWPGSRV